MIVGLTSGARVNPYAALLIDELADRGVPAAFVLSAERGPLGDLWERLLRRGVAGALRALRRRTGGGATGPAPLATAAAERGLSLHAPLATVCAAAQVEHVRVADLNAPDAAQAVRARRADVLINAGGGLFRRDLLAASSRGILNAHMARLPDLRGVDVLEWSLLLGLPMGVTIHWLDGGVDTGGLLAFESLTAQPGDTLASLRERAVLLSARAMAQQVARLGKGDSAGLPAGADPPGAQYFALHPVLRRRAEMALTASAPPLAGGDGD